MEIKMQNMRSAVRKFRNALILMCRNMRLSAGQMWGNPH